MPISRQIASYLVKTRYEDLSSEVVEFTKLCIVDWLASALAGRDKPPIQMIREMVEEAGGHPQATLITGGKSSVLHAALLNGAASHIVELDDVHKGSILHAATVVIPAALAIAEWKKISGRELLLAVALGYEVCFRVGEAVSPSHYYYWHNTATCGTFGATAAAAKLLGLSEEQIVHALGSAGTQAAGLWEFIEDGAMSKQLHPGKAAMNGVLSALLAEKGFTGAGRIFEGRRGFFEAMANEYNASKMTDGLGTTFKIMENSFKIHASCRHTHPAMDLAKLLRNEKNIRPDEIQSVHVKAYQDVLNITDNPNPQTVYAAKFSLQYCVALAFVTGNTSLPDFNEDALHDKTIRSLMDKIRVTMDPDIHAAYPEKWGSRLEVELNNGEIVTIATDYPKGDPENPVSAADLIDKFHVLTADLPQEETEHFLNAILTIEEYESVGDVWAVHAAGRGA